MTFAQTFGRASIVIPEHERSTVGREGADVRIGREHLQPVLAQIHLRPDLLVKQHFVRERGTLKSRRDLRSDRPAADLRAAFQHERVHARFRQIERGHQSVVSAADDHYACHATRSARIFIAALRPGAPMIPPPGWVADPHI